jgi:site-specific DNA-methyltransferase (adenine-specific)
MREQPEGPMIKPYYQEKNATIYHGDCREILPEIGGFDLLVTDPPYGISFISNSRKLRKHKRIAGDDRMPTQTLAGLIEKAERASYVFCRWDNLAELPRPKSVLAWVKNNWSMGNLRHEHGRMWEAICFYPGPQHEFIKRTPDVIQGRRTGNKHHPTEKPVSVMTQLIMANQGVMVFDPYMGSGTTLIAAKNLNRKAVGIEIEEKYCEIAAERLRQGTLPL